MKIIVLGKCCRISQQLQKVGLKGIDSLFEWMKSDKFKDILKITKMVVNGNAVDITKRSEFPGNDFLHDTEIRTTHYTDKLDDIFKRRSDRLISDIKGTDPILFIRDDDDDNLSKEDLIEFMKLVEQVNSKCIYQILLMSPKHKYKQIMLDNITHTIHTENDEEYYQMILTASSCLQSKTQ
jgi:hypothetical protein